MKKIILLLCLLLICCSKDDTPSENTIFFKEFYSVNIAPTITEFRNELLQQLEDTQTFKTHPNTTNFNKLQQQWLVCAQLYVKASLYNYTPLKHKFYYQNIYNYPINTPKIEENIKEKNNFDTSYLANKSTTVKGLGSIEYLLFHEQNTTLAFDLLRTDSARVNYLIALTTETLRQANLIVDFWENDYKTEFENLTGSSCDDNARCLSFNQIINSLDITKVSKIGKPAGFEKSDNISLFLLEAYRSKNSLQLIEATLQEVEKIYSLSPVSFSTIINQIDTSKNVSNTINTNFKKVYKAIDNIPENLHKAITTHPETVVKLHTDISDLTRNFSVDGASLLSISVLPTDNDSD